MDGVSYESTYSRVNDLSKLTQSSTRSLIILLFAGVIYYDRAESMLEAQRADILTRTVDYAVECINDELERVRSVTASMRTALRYTPMPINARMKPNPS